MPGNETIQVARQRRNSVRLSEEKYIFIKDIMFTENVQKSSDIVCSCDAPG
jgi:hypothetical protein